jgi:hypothetical protein
MGLDQNVVINPPMQRHRLAGRQGQRWVVVARQRDVGVVRALVMGQAQALQRTVQCAL